MPGDPKECREHAACCRLRAADAPNESMANTYLKLARTWEQLAAELESAAAFLNAMDQLEADALGRERGSGQIIPSRTAQML
jgi:alpha-ketoglutarate-dependent taurine dioxygenase